MTQTAVFAVFTSLTIAAENLKTASFTTKVVFYFILVYNSSHSPYSMTNKNTSANSKQCCVFGAPGLVSAAHFHTFKRANKK